MAGVDMYFYIYPNDRREDNPVLVKHTDLVCWWPRPGAYNTPRGAVYIGRKAIRTMRKSALPNEHYNIRYGTVGRVWEIMLILRKGPERQDLNFAVKVLNEELSPSVAITRDIILARGKFGEILVIFRGLYAGDYQNGEFISTFPGSPLAKLVRIKLAREGIR
jgi:hypothetical protein